MSTIPSIASQVYDKVNTDQQSSHPPRFTNIYSLELYSDTGERIEVAIDPAIYQDDWDNPYAENFDEFLHTNDKCYNIRIQMRPAVYLNDSRYKDPNFRKHQVERAFNGKIPFASLENYWVNHLCGNEVEEYRASMRRENEIRREREIQRLRQDSLDPMNPLHCAATKLTLLMHDNITAINEKIIDFVGDRNDPEAQTRRSVAKKCVDGVYIAGTMFFFHYLLGSAYSKPH